MHIKIHKMFAVLHTSKLVSFAANLEHMCKGSNLAIDITDLIFKTCKQNINVETVSVLAI